MKALQYTAPSAFAVNEIATPSIADDEVLLASRAVGICHSDIELLEGRYIIPFTYPIIPGHEWSAEVIEVGSKVTAFKPGDRVVGECVIGVEHFGFSISGAAAEYFIAKDAWLHKIPDNVSWTQGALVEPFSCGYYATVRADNLDASDTVGGWSPLVADKTLTVTAEGLSDKNIYVQSLTVNGKPWNSVFLPYREIKDGGSLVFTMGPEPNKQWGTETTLPE